MGSTEPERASNKQKIIINMFIRPKKKHTVTGQDNEWSCKDEGATK